MLELFFCKCKMLIIFNAKKYVNYTESYSRFWGMNHGEERLLKLIKDGP